VPAPFGVSGPDRTRVDAQGIGNALHARDGLAQATVGAGTNISARNIADLAGAMRNPVPQRAGGVALMLSARQRRDAGDPLCYL
jgi:hypothetical protein